jgi:hypothetical protein
MAAFPSNVDKGGPAGELTQLAADEANLEAKIENKRAHLERPEPGEEREPVGAHLYKPILNQHTKKKNSRPNCKAMGGKKCLKCTHREKFSR